MDSLKSLMDNKEYDLVLKITKDSKDINYLFYRVSAFLATGHGQEALQTIEENRSILEGDLPLLMKIHIEILCLLGKFDKAYEEADYYKNLPYVSQQVEELIADLPKIIRAEEKKSFTSKDISDDELKSRLLEKDDAVVLPALDMIRNKDINIFINEVKEILLNFPKQSIRSFALLLLVQKVYDAELGFNHLGTVITVNPSKIDPPFIGSEFNDFVRALQQEIKDPAVSEDAIQVLSSYIIYMYPVKLDINYGVLITALQYIAYDYLQKKDEPPLEYTCAKKKISLDEVEELIYKIKDCIENF